MKKILVLLAIIGLFLAPALAGAHDSYSCRYVKGKRDCDWHWHWHIAIDSRSLSQPDCNRASTQEEPCYKKVFVEEQWVRTGSGYKWVGPHWEHVPCKR